MEYLTFVYCLDSMFTDVAKLISKTAQENDEGF